MILFQPDLAIKIGLNMPSNVQKNKKISELMSGLVNEAEALSIVKKLPSFFSGYCMYIFYFLLGV